MHHVHPFSISPVNPIKSPFIDGFPMIFPLSRDLFWSEQPQQAVLSRHFRLDTSACDVSLLSLPVFSFSWCGRGGIAVGGVSYLAMQSLEIVENAPCSDSCITIDIYIHMHVISVYTYVSIYNGFLHDFCINCWLPKSHQVQNLSCRRPGSHHRWCPSSLAKLVDNVQYLGLIWGVISIVNGDYKPTNITGGVPPCTVSSYLP